MNEWPREIACWLDEGKRIAVATVVAVDGSAPRPVGARMVVSSLGEIAGSVSGGCVESAVVAEALDVIASGTARLLHYGISDDEAWDVGLACGGEIDVFVQAMSAELAVEYQHLMAHAGVAETVLTGANAGSVSFRSAHVDDASGTIEDGGERVFIEVVAYPAQLIVFGAVHAAQPLTVMANELGYRVTVIDARPALATEERFPDVHALTRAWPADAYAELDITEHDAIVVLSHDPKFDEPAIVGALETDAGYIGAVGSRKTVADRFVRLRESGVSEDALQRVHSPIGLNIGGTTPAEMAVSILGEIIATRYGRPGGALRSGEGVIRGAAS